jgi:iron complex outermembrane receptor protein
VGMKGRLSNGFSYAAAVFDMRWDKPQISASLPSGNLAVYNGNTAESKGFELEVSGPLFFEGLTYMVGGAYTDAKLTSSFSLPANNGQNTGTIVPGLITGTAGQQLPGAPKGTAAATLTYERKVAPGYDLNVSLNGTYSTRVPLYLSARQSQFRSPPYGLANLSATLRHDRWRVGAYVKNVADRRVALIPSVVAPYLLDQDLATTELINPPREIGFRVGYGF